MKVFHCDHCGQLLFFENVRCVACGHALAFLPDLGVMGSLERTDDGKWRSPIPRAEGWAWRLCENYERENVCNWAVAWDDSNGLCLSCRLTRVIPDLGRPGNREAWAKLETAKRRLVYSFLALGLPFVAKSEDEFQGLAFEFLADDAVAGRAVTGHSAGVITLAVAEANDAEREKRRLALREPYRTLLGHFRHESGHYFWTRLIEGGPRIERFRALFGDDREDYAAALDRHYRGRAPADWQQRFVTTYASAHPWEDWAETWAHYIHMSDTLETAAACGLSLRPRRRDEPTLRTPPPTSARPPDFDRMIEDWFPVTYALNNLNRGLGLADAYPFVLSQPAIEKLRFVHETVHGARAIG